MKIFIRVQLSPSLLEKEFGSYLSLQMLWFLIGLNYVSPIVNQSEFICALLKLVLLKTRK